MYFGPLFVSLTLCVFLFLFFLHFHCFSFPLSFSFLFWFLIPCSFFRCFLYFSLLVSFPFICSSTWSVFVFLFLHAPFRFFLFPYPSPFCLFAFLFFLIHFVFGHKHINSPGFLFIFLLGILSRASEFCEGWITWAVTHREKALHLRCPHCFQKNVIRL